MNHGKVYIIGAGPGDVGLLTLKGAECIKKADVIVYDNLVSLNILSLSRNDAQLVDVGKLPDYHKVPQDEINAILVKYANENKIVARVKGGDPFVFGRGGEEALVLRQEGIDFEIIPGITSAIAVPAYAGIPVTHRDICTSFHVITGHEKEHREESAVNYQELAKLDGTLVFLMGISNLEGITKNLIQYGKNIETPVAVIQKGTTSRQRVVTGTLADIYKIVKENNIKPPAVTVIGYVNELHRELDWFNKGQLSGKNIIVTRAREQASKLTETLTGYGAQAMEFPVIKIEDIADYQELDLALEKINQYGRIVFTSINGVEKFFKRMMDKGIDIRNLKDIKIDAIGEATAKALSEKGLNTDLMPDKFLSQELTKLLVEKADKNEKILLARADIADVNLYKELLENGFSVDDITVYKTVKDGRFSDKIKSLILKKEIDYVTFTSSSTVLNFLSALDLEPAELNEYTKFVCIGPVTAKTAEDSGLKVDVVSEIYTIDGMVNAIIRDMERRTE